MKALLLLLFLLPNPACTSTKAVRADAKTAYLCGSGKTKKYHLSSSCRGLSNCGYKTVKTTLEKAKQEGRTLCGWED